jgi:hypothetical protein
LLLVKFVVKTQKLLVEHEIWFVNPPYISVGLPQVAIRVVAEATLGPNEYIVKVANKITTEIVKHATFLS